MASTLDMSKQELVALAERRLEAGVSDGAWSLPEKLALTCRILFDGGHDSGLAGQITGRSGNGSTYYTQRLGHGFDEITPSNLIEVNEDLEVVAGEGIPNPANRFHTWIYRARPEINCIIHTHPPHVSALSMLEVPMNVSHMDTSPLYDDCAFLEKWPGVPVGNEEGEIISAALGDKRAILLAHHGQLVVGKSVEEACMLALLMEKAARLQLLAMAAGTIKPLPPALANEAHDWVSTDKRDRVTFAYYARRALRAHADCLG
ncbi:aldolase [Paraburkholderia unamae]|uniref:L-fuculose-phosphate aldolase n=1 Tax=Paraburkholderia unamae TaxID=219649 RepID=A0ABX5KGT9_9BURK|nr:aldolase [Paraburkholderia unamae]PVX72802.1 L-fuculose-phosphate aldolase [Paraburkholderia unamae]RAR54254.1 L-fuculose-phosphate aldolase [Paraburkholderia unamae]CAG9272500.1 Ribulose-5-phosphate 4-epimerase and related epimerases and aldolases [Paraburkholderia unamae]